MAKAEGAILWVDFTQGGTYEQIGTCMFGLKPAGFSRGTVDKRRCINATASPSDTGTLTYTPLTFIMMSEPTTDGSGVQDKIETAIKDDTIVAWAVTLPESTQVYMYGTGKFSEFDWEDFDPDQDMARPGEIVPDAAPTYTGTAPPTGP